MCKDADTKNLSGAIIWDNKNYNTRSVIRVSEFFSNKYLLTSKGAMRSINHKIQPKLFFMGWFYGAQHLKYSVTDYLSVSCTFIHIPLEQVVWKTLKKKRENMKLKRKQEPVVILTIL